MNYNQLQKFYCGVDLHARSMFYGKGVTRLPARVAVEFGRSGLIGV